MEKKTGFGTPAAIFCLRDFARQGKAFCVSHAWRKFTGNSRQRLPVFKISNLAEPLSDGGRRSTETRTARRATSATTTPRRPPRTQSTRLSAGRASKGSGTRTRSSTGSWCPARTSAAAASPPPRRRARADGVIHACGTTRPSASTGFVLRRPSRPARRMAALKACAASSWSSK